LAFKYEIARLLEVITLLKSNTIIVSNEDYIYCLINSSVSKVTISKNISV